MTKDEIERVARAICDLEGCAWPEQLAADNGGTYKAIARAAIAALRQPTEPPANTVRLRLAVAASFEGAASVMIIRNDPDYDEIKHCRQNVEDYGLQSTHECIATIDVPAVPKPAEVVGVVENSTD